MAKKQSIWLTEKYTADSGKEYQRYVLDAAGNRIPKDADATAVVREPPKRLSPEEIEAKKAAKHANKQKRIISHINKQLKIRRAKYKVPSDAMSLMRTLFDRQKKGTGSLNCAEFGIKGDSIRAVTFDIDLDWILIHSIAKKGFDVAEEYFFFNPYNADWVSFDVAAYLAMPKPRTMPWPDKSSKVLEPEDIPAAKKKREKTAA